jgi:hypothetical protein
LRTWDDFESRVLLLGHSWQELQLVSASRSRLFALRGGYRLAASAPGTALLVLPVQFSHCWRIDHTARADMPRIFRVNIIQTGILFKNDLDIRLHFAFDPWNAECRLEDARDAMLFGFN